MNLFQKRNTQIVILFLIIILGAIAGSIFRALHPDWNIWNNQTFRQGMGIVTEYRFYCIAAPVFWLAITAILGLSATGLPFVPCILFLRGAAVGAILEQIYEQSGFLTALPSLLMIMPYIYLSSFVMLFAAREALKFSMQITGLLCDSSHDEEVSVKLYIIRFMILFLFIIILGILQNFLLTKFA